MFQSDFHPAPWSVAIICVLVELTAGQSIFKQQSVKNPEAVRLAWLRRMERPLATPTEAGNREATRRSEADQQNELALKANERFVLVLQIMVNFLQSISAAMALNVEWSTHIPRLSGTQGWASGTENDRESMFSSEYLPPSDESTFRSVIQVILTVFIPHSVTALICFYWAYNIFWRRMSWKYFVRRCILTVVSGLYFSYLSLAKTAMNFFYCDEIRDWLAFRNLYLHYNVQISFMNIGYFVSGRRAAVHVAAIPLVFVFAYPIILGAVIAEQREYLRTDWIQGPLGVLTIGFKPEFAYWGCQILIRKALIATVTMFSFKLGSNLQGTLLFCIFLFALFLHFACLPYQTDRGPLNFLEGLSLFVCCTTVMSSIILRDSNTATDVVKLCVLFFVFASNLVTFAIFAYHLLTNKYTEIKHTLLSEGVDAGSGAPTEVLKSYIRHKSEKFRNFIVSITA